MVDWSKIIALYVTGQVSFPLIYKFLLLIYKKKTNNPIKDVNREFIDEKMQSQQGIHR